MGPPHLKPQVPLGRVQGSPDLPDRTAAVPTEDFPLAPGNKVVFSSYPGTILSGDDFYILGSGLVSHPRLGSGRLGRLPGQQGPVLDAM